MKGDRKIRMTRKTAEAIKARNKKAIEELNPIDDHMFKKFAEEPEFCEEILKVLLENHELELIESVPQWEGTNLKGRSVRLDAKCRLSDGTHVNIEVQKADNDDHERRVRYNGAVLTTNLTDTGTDFREVPNVTVVYIMKFDLFKHDRAAYKIVRIIEETKEAVYNGFTEIYINATARDESEISALMKVFTEDNAYDDRFPVTSGLKRRYKGREKKKAGGKEEMSDTLLREILKEKEEEVTKRVRKSTTRQTTSRINRLYSILLDSGRSEDAKRCTTDFKYQEKLMRELLPEEFDEEDDDDEE